MKGLTDVARTCPDRAIGANAGSFPAQYAILPPFGNLP